MLRSVCWYFNMEVSGPILFPEASIINYRHTLRNIPEERWSHLPRGGSLKSRKWRGRLVYIYIYIYIYMISAGERPAAAHLLKSWVRIPPGACIFVCCECRVLSGRGLCDEPITRPEESYRLCCVVVCDLETSRIGAPYIYDISHLRVNYLILEPKYLKFTACSKMQLQTIIFDITKLFLTENLDFVLKFEWKKSQHCRDDSESTCVKVRLQSVRWFCVNTLRTGGVI